MDACEPRVRRRGFFLHSDTTSEPETGEHENPEGVASASGSASPLRAPQTVRQQLDGSQPDEPGPTKRVPEIRSGSVTGSRQRAHLPR